MKKLIFISFLATVFACHNKTSEETTADAKVAAAEATLDAAKEAQTQARKTATAEQLRAFREESNVLIWQNETRIAELKANAKKAGKNIDATYQKSIDKLEEKNNEMQVKLDSFQNNANDDWESFKRGFNRDKDDLRHSLRNFK